MPPRNPDTQRYVDELHRILNPLARDLEPRTGDMGFVAARVKNINEETREVRAVVSTAEIDRYGESVADEAWTPETIEAFLGRNPVLLAGHQHVSESGAPTVIGQWTALEHVRNVGLVGVARFAETELAEKWWQLYRQRAMRAFSIGFIAKSFEMREVDAGAGEKKRVRTFTGVELIEISAVAVPANASALVRAAGFAGMPTDPAEAADAGDDDGSGKLSNRKLRALIHREVKPAVRDAIREEVREQFRQFINREASGVGDGYVAFLARDLVNTFGDQLLAGIRSGGRNPATVNPADRYFDDAMDHLEAGVDLDDLDDLDGEDELEDDELLGELQALATDFAGGGGASGDRASRRSRR